MNVQGERRPALALRLLSRYAAAFWIGVTLAAGPTLAAPATPSSAVPSSSIPASSVPSSSVPSSAGLARITDFFRNEVATGKIAGGSVLIQQHGKPLYFEMFGVRNAATGKPTAADTIYRIHSMSKAITSVAAMQLVDEGKLGLDDPVAKYIPSFAGLQVGVQLKSANGDPALQLQRPKRPVTVRDLLRHSSGITYGFYGDSLVRKVYFNADVYAGDFDNAEFAERIARLPLEDQPGSVWTYGHSTDVLGRVMEVAAGQSLLALEKQRLFDPLGMTGTSYYLTDPATHDRLAEPLPTDSKFNSSLQEDPRLIRKWESGGGGIITTMPDLARLMQMLLNRGELDGRRYMSAATFDEMTKNQITPATGVEKGNFYFPGDGFAYSLGFGVRIGPGDKSPPGVMGELKWDGAGGTYFFIDPVNDMFVVLLVQTPSQRGRIQIELKKLVYEALAPPPPQ